VATILFADTVDMSCWRISILRQSEAILSFSAPFVKTTMIFHSPRAMVATGPHGEISLRLPRRKSKFSAAWAGHLDARRSPGRGNAGASQIRDSCPGETSRTLLLVSNHKLLSNREIGQGCEGAALLRVPQRWPTSHSSSGDVANGQSVAQ
jgi:hypothetical protein